MPPICADRCAWVHSSNGSCTASMSSGFFPWKACPAFHRSTASVLRCRSVYAGYRETLIVLSRIHDDDALILSNCFVSCGYAAAERGICFTVLKYSFLSTSIQTGESPEKQGFSFIMSVIGGVLHDCSTHPSVFVDMNVNSSDGRCGLIAGINVPISSSTAAIRKI